MRFVAAVCGAVFAMLIVSCPASAQTVASDPAPLNWGMPSALEPFVAQLSAPPAVPSFAIASPAEPMPFFQKDAPAAGAGSDQAPPGVYGVFPSYRYQVYAGYTFLRFYVIPNVAENTNGVNFSIAYYFRDSLAVDGEAAATFGTYSGESSRFYLYMGGLRYRHPVGRFDVWIHGLAGGAHFTPLTPYGNQDAFAYEAGGGVDFTPRGLRLSFRLQADAFGSNFFGTYQYSPKISFGVVYKD